MQEKIKILQDNSASQRKQTHPELLVHWQTKHAETNETANIIVLHKRRKQLCLGE